MQPRIRTLRLHPEHTLPPCSELILRELTSDRSSLTVLTCSSEHPTIQALAPRPALKPPLALLQFSTTTQEERCNRRLRTRQLGLLSLSSSETVSLVLPTGGTCIRADSRSVPHLTFSSPTTIASSAPPIAAQCSTCFHRTMSSTVTQLSTLSPTLENSKRFQPQR